MTLYDYVKQLVDKIDLKKYGEKVYLKQHYCRQSVIKVTDHDLKVLEKHIRLKPVSSKDKQTVIRLSGEGKMRKFVDKKRRLMGKTTPQGKNLLDRPPSTK